MSAFLVAGYARTASAEVPATLTHQGRLFDTEGHAVSGPAVMHFAFYATPNAATPVASETLQVTLEDGYFSATLGESASLEGLFDGAIKYFGVRVGEDPEMIPRVPVQSVPYAMTCGDAIGDLHPTSVSIGGALVIDESGQWVGDPTGLLGPTGPQGAEGPSGPPGPAGQDGPMGPVGATGPAGPTGPVGATGVVGPTGPQGVPGPMGALGATGAIGPTGPQGVAGPMGAVGAIGAAGAMGAVGPTGPQGSTGATGPAGPPGPPGAFPAALATKVGNNGTASCDTFCAGSWGNFTGTCVGAKYVAGPQVGKFAACATQPGFGSDLTCMCLTF